MRRFAASLSILAMCSGCTVRLGDFTVGSPRNIPTNFSVKAQKVVGRDCAYQILGIPIGTLNPTIDGAVDNALEQAPGADALADVALFQEVYFFVVFAQICIRTEGKAISTRE